MLRTLPDGRNLLVVGQKDGHVWGLDPDKQGAVVWSRQVGLGLDGGGGALMWGAASDDRLAYFPITRASRPLAVWPALLMPPWPTRISDRPSLDMSIDRALVKSQ